MGSLGGGRSGPGPLELLVPDMAASSDSIDQGMRPILFRMWRIHFFGIVCSAIMAGLFCPFISCDGGFPGGWWTPYAAYCPVVLGLIVFYALPALAQIRKQNKDFHANESVFWPWHSECPPSLKTMDTGAMLWALFVNGLFDRFKDLIFLAVVLQCNDQLTPLWVKSFPGFCQGFFGFLQLRGFVLLTYAWSSLFKIVYTQRVMVADIAGLNKYFPVDSLSTVWKFGHYVDFGPIVKPLEKVAFQTQLLKLWHTTLEFWRKLGQDLINEELLQLFVQTSVYGLKLRAAPPCATPPTLMGQVTLNGCPDLAILPGLVIGLLALVPKFAKIVKHLLDYSHLKEAAEEECVTNHVTEDEGHSPADMRSRADICHRYLAAGTVVATFLAIWILVKLVMAHMCPSHIWNLTSFSCAVVPAPVS